MSPGVRCWTGGWDRLGESVPPVLYLLGFMGSGKTTVGRRVADQLGREHLDTDRLIERFTGRSIPDLFDRLGEASFRQLETRMLDRIRRRKDGPVVSTGGGLPVFERNRRMMDQSGTTVALRTGWREAFDRVQGTDRPLARDPEEFRYLWEARQPVYDRAAFQVNTEQTTPEQAAEAILTWLRDRPGSGTGSSG